MIEKAENSFARDLGGRKREKAPGYDVGQELVVCNANSTLRDVGELS